MLQIEIDGKPLAVEQGKTVMEAANQIGTYIPHFCYHKKLSIAANCRMCLVEVEKAPKPLPACATPVTDGMKVKTASPLAKQAQKGVMEFLLINHPLDCPICDQGGECQLQDLAVGYGNSSGRYQEAKRAVVGKDMGPLVSAAEMSRCIHCTRCVRFTEEIAGMQEIGMANRGEFSEIMPFIGKAVETELSGNVIDLCPVGALTSKPFRYSARPWELSRRKSISAHDALGSNLIVQTKDHRVMRVLPLENEAINECWLSDRDRFAYLGLNHPDRLQKPMIKQDNRWHEVDWQTALDYVVKGLKGVSADFGAEGVGIWANPANTVEELYLTRRLAEGLSIKSLDAELFRSDKRVNATLQGALWLGQSIQELADNHAVLVVGANLRTEQPLLTARLRQAVKKGMALSVLGAAPETLHMALAEHIGLHPARWAQELQRLSTLAGESDAAESSKTVAELVKAEKSAIVLGAEVQKHPDFAGIFAAAQALAEATHSVLGILPEAANSVGVGVLNFRPQDGGATYAQMLETPKKAVILANIDPGADVPAPEAAQAALRQAQTVIALTAYTSPALLECADVLLPIAPFTETSGSLINMEGRLQSFYGVVQPLGETRPMWKVLRVLGTMLGLEGFGFDSSEEILKEAVDPHTLPGRLNNRLNAVTAREGTLNADAVVRVGGVGLYQSDAIVRRSSPLQATSWAQAPVARIHPSTLERLNGRDGEVLHLKQNGEAVAVTAQADAAVPENVVVLPQHPANYALGALMQPIAAA